MKKTLSWRPKPLRLLNRSVVRPLRVKPRAREVIGEPISADTRLFVWKRDGGLCRNCDSTRNIHFDHIIPRSWGGSSLAENIELLCRECNLKKGARLSSPLKVFQDQFNV